MLAHGVGQLAFNPVLDAVGREGDTIGTEFMFERPGAATRTPT